jgi:hypothetical protein
MLRHGNLSLGVYAVGAGLGAATAGVYSWITFRRAKATLHWRPVDAPALQP